MRLCPLLVALFVLCALLALGDAFPSATSAASSTAVLPPAGEVVELTVRKGRKKRKRKKNEIPRSMVDRRRNSSQPPLQKK
jgi:hypothetical protein